MVLPIQTLSGPLSTPAFGSGLTVTTRVTVAIPHVLLTVYVIVLVPAVTPVTTPLELPTVAFAFAALHVPPGIVLVSVIDDPTQTAESPPIVPAAGSVLIVTMYVELATPHAPLTV
jgi:hypothetical protein